MYEKMEKLSQERNVSFYRISKDLGFSQSMFNAWKNGKSIPKRDKIQMIADYFNVPISYFYDEETTYEASAGRGRINSEYGETESHYKDDGDYVRVKIVGDSMLPELRDGDVVRVRLTKETAPKKLSIIKINGDEVCCKRVETTDTGVWIRSDNEDYDDVFYSVQEVMTLPVTIVGVVEELVSRKY